MMGHRQVDQVALFYEFSIETHVPADHLLRSIDRFVELGELRRELAAFYSTMGRPSVDPQLMIRMLIVGYCLGIRSERRLCEEVHLNLAYRWFCRLGLDGGVPDHSTFSKNRHGRFRQSDLLRRLFETVHHISHGEAPEPLVSRGHTSTVSLKLLLACPSEGIGPEQERACDARTASAPHLNVPSLPALPQRRHRAEPRPCATGVPAGIPQCSCGGSGNSLNHWAA